MNNNFIILLTTCVYVKNKDTNDINYRINLYTKQIKRWLDETELMIFVVESSGYEFNDIKHPRLNIISFKLDDKYCYSSSISEAHSILYILNKIKDNEYYKNCNYILKVTGRYFLENIDKYLKNLPPKEYYLQNHFNDSLQWQHSEYFGIKKELFNNLILDIINMNNLFESSLYKCSKDKDYMRIGPFKNNVPRGGDKMLLSNL